ncbi:MAG: hypothetical protein K9H26_19200 [Prolixibacteraceae bacterium]|nr:hypothetical protein [Prolixibacteraceae bacterium]
MPFEVPSSKFLEPQTFTGFAGSENSKYLVPELYIDNDDFLPLNAGSVANRFNADGTIKRVFGEKNPDIEFDAIYNLIKDEETGFWKWTLIE